MTRLIVIGRNSQVWQDVAPILGVTEYLIALGHSEIAGTQLHDSDIVWILSYSRDIVQNRMMFQRLYDIGARRVVYVSSATTNVAEETNCYSYPRAKLMAERDAREILDARIVRLGAVYKSGSELPSGGVAATSVAEIASAMKASRCWARAIPENLFSMVHTEFDNRWERIANAVYGSVIARLPTPCLLRPIDALLRMLGWRWYGYVYLSNRLWRTTR